MCEILCSVHRPLKLLKGSMISPLIFWILDQSIKAFTKSLKSFKIKIETGLSTIAIFQNVVRHPGKTNLTRPFEANKTTHQNSPTDCLMRARKILLCS